MILNFQKIEAAVAARAWWWVVLAILLIGGYWHLSGYNYGLTLFEFGAGDEPRIYQDAYYQMQGMSDKITLPGYPPGHLGIDYLAHLILKAQYQDAKQLYTVEGIHLVRLWAAISNLITALGLMLIGKALKQPIAGIIAALIFLSSLVILQNTVLALSEAFLITTIVFTLYFAILGIITRKPMYALMATVFALLAVLLKYPAAITMGIALVATLWLMVTDRWQRWGKVLLLQCGLIGCVGIWLIAGYDVGRLTSIGTEAAEFAGSVQSFSSNPVTFMMSLPLGDLLAVAVGQIHLTNLAALMIFCLGLWALSRIAPVWQWVLYGALGMFYVLWCALVPFYLQLESSKPRYVSPVSAIGALLVGLAVSSGALWLGQRLKRRVLCSGLAIAIVMVWLLPQFQVMVSRAMTMTLPNTFDDYLNWVHRALPTDGTLLIRYPDWVFFTQNDITELTIPTRTWYQGYLPERSRDAWLNDAIRYAYVEDYEVEQFKARPNGAAELQSMLLLKEFPAPEERHQKRGQDINIYRLFPMQHSAEAVFGNMIRWVGYDVSATTLKPGDTLLFSPYWQMTHKPDADYIVYLHLVPMLNRDVLAQADGIPAKGVHYPTSAWIDPFEIIIGSEFSLVLPPHLLPGSYRLIMGLYHPQSQQRLLTANEQDYVEVVQIVVAADE